MRANLSAAIEEHQKIMTGILALEPLIANVISCLRRTFERGGILYLCGNGGSATDAQHFAAEFTGRFETDRKGYPAISLTNDTAALTAIGNDYGFERIFSRQLESLANPKDLLLLISTSGHSQNLINAAQQAKQQQITTIGLLGRDGGQLAKWVDYPLIVPAKRTSRIQESHIFILHFICEAFER